MEKADPQILVQEQVNLETEPSEHGRDYEIISGLRADDLDSFLEKVLATTAGLDRRAQRYEPHLFLFRIKK